MCIGSAITRPDTNHGTARTRDTGHLSHSPVAPMHESFESFRQDALARGFNEVLERRWPPSEVVPLHTHPFDASALVVEGEMWLTVGGQTRHLRPGDRFELSADVPHDERYGIEGAVYWVARR